MLDPISVQLFLKVLPTLAQYAGRQAYKAIKTPVKLAIGATARHFPRHPNLSEWLNIWCASAEFFQLQASLKEGDRIEPSGIFDSFVKFVGYVDPEHGRRCAEEVLPVFFRQIDEQLLGLPGLAIIDQRGAV